MQLTLLLLQFMKKVMAEVPETTMNPAPQDPSLARTRAVEELETVAAGD